MRTETFVYPIACDQCGENIPAMERRAVIQTPVKNLFNVPMEMRATKTKHVHLKHVYTDAQQKINNRFVQLDFFEGAK